ncbi:MAG: dockerin type I repeat-containing protein [Ruminococcus flavefaciens]|nr:dockerin type I repeat-containing protein [Ruminococcus flavefaciens]
MKKFLSALMSATMALCAVPMTSNADYVEYTLPYQPATSDADREEIYKLISHVEYYVDGNSVVFNGGGSDDFVTVTAPDAYFTTERTENDFIFTPEQDGKYIVSRVYLVSEPIYYPIELEIFYDLMADVTAPAGYGYVEGKCDYYFPLIKNFEITYSSETGTEVSLLGERDYMNYSNVGEIAGISSVKKEDEFIEMETDEIFNDASYYILASQVSPTPFIYFDYVDENKKDKSVLCVRNGYAWADGAITVTGNAEKTDTFSGGSAISGDLAQSTCDVVFYTLIEPTGDGLAEIYYDPNYNNPYDVYIQPLTMILNVEDGQFIPHIETIGDDFMYGDMNFDYEVNIADAVLMNKYLLGTAKFTSTQYQCADLNCDGTVDIFDMVLFRQELTTGKELN